MTNDFLEKSTNAIRKMAAASYAIDYALELEDFSAVAFLSIWRRGDFDAIKDLFPDAPDSIFYENFDKGEPSTTKGQWSVSRICKTHVVCGSVGIANTGGHSAIEDSERIEKEQIANAKLISAAPDLYLALKNMVRHGPWITSADTRIAVEALEKARGVEA